MGNTDVFYPLSDVVQFFKKNWKDLKINYTGPEIY